ncbi:MAG: nucleotidyltransferase family protein [Thermodesulfobacteriota bacterium]
MRAAVVLAAGYGKRLRPHTEQLPKPLLHVAGEPIINSLFRALQAAGVSRLIVVTGHLGHLLEEYLTDTFSSAFDLHFVRQEKVVGSADALSQATETLMGLDPAYCMIVAADYQLPQDYLQALVAFHDQGSQQISLSLRNIEAERAGESSLVDFGEDGEILRINEKPETVEGRDKLVAASLIYILPTTVLDYLADVGLSKRGEKELPSVINRMIADGITARGLVQEEMMDWEREYRADSS